jgi:hypothetical protein
LQEIIPIENTLEPLGTAQPFLGRDIAISVTEALPVITWVSKHFTDGRDRDVGQNSEVAKPKGQKPKVQLL